MVRLQASWADVSGEVRRDVNEDKLRFADTALFVTVCALAHSSYPVNILRDHYSRCAVGGACFVAVSGPEWALSLWLCRAGIFYILA